MGSYRVCVCFHRKFKAEEAMPPEEVKELFNKYAGGGAHMTADFFSKSESESSSSPNQEKRKLN